MFVILECSKFLNIYRTKSTSFHAHEYGIKWTCNVVPMAFDGELSQVNILNLSLLKCTHAKAK